MSTRSRSMSSRSSRSLNSASLQVRSGRMRLSCSARLVTRSRPFSGAQTNRGSWRRSWTRSQRMAMRWCSAASRASGSHVCLLTPRAGLASEACSSDVETTRNVLDLQDGPAILGGHSFGGAVITEAGGHERVAGLVYITAFVPDQGESSQHAIADRPRARRCPQSCRPRTGSCSSACWPSGG